ncbi:ribonuclease H [Vulcanibacillus modesticaldus]|uniref:ribonuclease H n=1 Tax=Vulcanibacillus modesticaldus TaxID=337097 RepID=A0A1D2YSN5_9BACI|nr:ribonuclease H [Vulcanibacillus modesticaldus]
MIDKYDVYTDGACSNNQASGGQPGGWGVVFTDGRKYFGGDPSTTNNRMELKAAIEALKNTPIGSEVNIYSDSAYVINAFNQKWIPNWIKNGWKTSKGKPVENQDLWMELLDLEKERNVKWIKVKGHSGNKWNELADKLAVDAIPSEPKVILALSKRNYSLLLKVVKELATKDPTFIGLFRELSQDNNS